MAKLVCVVGMNKDDEFPLVEGATVIGRSPECNIVLFDKKCSRRHCQVYKKGSYYALEDLQSKHGTRLNGQPVDKRQSLGLGDKIQIGKSTLLLSDKALGDIVSQTAADAAADLQDKGYGKLMGSTVKEIKSHMIEGPPDSGGGILGFFRSLFRKK